ncbi:MAG: hypothetical protein JNM72_19210 [Deltaproteobacteria bacterium]|nr:hypothetical protein [Deltaproteobacteria bacterium]
MKTTLRALLIPLLLLSACGGSGSAPSAADATKAGGVAKQLAADPAKGAEALKASGWSEAEFEALLYDIAADPALSKVYLEAMR